MGAFPFKIYCQKHIISTEFYVEFMCFWDNVLIMDTGRVRTVLYKPLQRKEKKTSVDIKLYGITVPNMQQTA